MATVQTGYTVRRLATGLDNLRRFAMVKHLRELIESHASLTELKAMGEDIVGGYVFDYAHLTVTLTAPFIAPHDAHPDELASKFFEFVSLDFAVIENLRDQIRAHDNEKKASSE